MHRFEGTVNQYTGDGIMALFGAPIAHEDHAQRACFTALHLRDALRHYADTLRVEQGLNFSVRIGINSGEVVVGKIGDDLRMDYTAQGHTVGLAQRMEQITAANAITISATTARLVEGYFTVRALGETRVKGVHEPVAVFQLEGLGAVRTRLDASRARGFSTFVGRHDEMATLEAAFERAVAGDGQVVGVVADAGVGKSRLCLEAVQRWRAKGIPVREAHCLAHGQTVPMLPVLEFLRGLFDIAADDSARITRNKVAGALLLLDRDIEPSLPLVFDLLGVADPAQPPVEMTDDVRERRMFDIVRRVLQARSAREPAVILWEDLHWIDDASTAFLAHLVTVVPATRTLLLLEFSPGVSRRVDAAVLLSPAAAAAAGAGGDRRAVAALARARTGTGRPVGPHPGSHRGNPFFIEEVVQSLVETGQLQGQRGAYRLHGSIEAIAIPATIQPLLAARIDRLSERDKTVLQAASVLGQEIAEGVLVETLDLPRDEVAAALRQLVAAEFLHEVALYPEPEFAFKHPLTEEVAYRSQLGEPRARLHGRAAAALERRMRDTRGEMVVVLAHHWERAGDALRAARWYRHAAEQTSMTRTRTSFQHWSKVRALSDRLPESPEQQELGTLARVQMFGTGGRIGAPEAEMAELFRECDAIVQRTGSDAARAHLLTGYGFYRLYTTGNVRAAADDAAAAVQLADRSGDVALQLGTRFMLCAANTARDLRRVLDTTQLAFDLIARHPDVGGIVLAAGVTPAAGFEFIRAAHPVTDGAAVRGGARRGAAKEPSPGERRGRRAGAHRDGPPRHNSRRRGPSRTGERARARGGRGQRQLERAGRRAFERGGNLPAAGALCRGARQPRSSPGPASDAAGVPAARTAPPVPHGRRTPAHGCGRHGPRSRTSVARHLRRARHPGRRAGGAIAAGRDQHRPRRRQGLRRRRASPRPRRSPAR